MANKVSEITKEDVAAYIRLDDASSSDLQLISELIVVSKAYIRSQTGLTNDQIDTHEDFIIVVKVLCQDMFDNRTLYVDTTNVNRVVDSILGSHRQNFLPGQPEAVVTPPAEDGEDETP